MNRFMGRAKHLAVFTLLVVGLLARDASATSIVWRTWEEIVRDSDFVGLVECQVAGGLVAKFKVIEAWKGKPEREEVFLRMSENYWMPQFPIALCGERSIVMASKITHPRPVPRLSEGDSVPLWWRDQPADYQLPLFQGVMVLTTNTDVFFDSPHKDLAAFRQAVIEMAEPGSDREEACVLRGLCDMKIFCARERKFFDEDLRYYPPTLSGESAILETALKQARTTRDVVDVLLAHARHYEHHRQSIASILSEGGRITLARVEQLSDDDSAVNSEDRQRIIRLIRERQEYDTRNTPEPATSLPPTEQDLDSSRAILQSGVDNEDFFKAFEVLTEHDPAFIARYLLTYQQVKGDTGHQLPYEYVLGSYFGWKCGRDRLEHFTTLLDAASPHIRVAAAVYMMFEDEKTATPHLRAFTRLVGVPGAWAALTLARRGDKEAVPRALRVFDTPGWGTMDGAPQRNLQQRLRVLLSNACKKGGIPMPELEYGPDADEAFDFRRILHRSEYAAWWERRRQQREAFTRNRAWWDANKDKLILHDPWLPEFIKQKID